MTSEQVMLSLMTRRAVLKRCARAAAQMLPVTLLLTAALALLTGCPPRGAEPLVSPYPSRQVWAVAPLSNESGSAQADGYTLADHLIRQLEGASNIDVLPLNRTLAAMQALRLRSVNSEAAAMQLMHTLGADGLIVGTVTAYDPYDPPKLGMAIELYTSAGYRPAEFLDPRQLSAAATDPNGQATGNPPTHGAAPNQNIEQKSRGQPVNVVSAVFDAGSPETVAMLKRYASDRGRSPEDYRDVWHRYRLSMDLYSEFVSYVMSWRLLAAERQRWQVTPTASARAANHPSP